MSASGLVDGILVLDVAPEDDRVALSRAIDVPTVFIGVPDDVEGLVCVDLDFEAAAALAVDRLADAGHRRIGFIGHPETAYVRSNFPPRVRRGIEDAAHRRDVALATAFPGEGDERRRDIGEAVRRMIADDVTALALHCDDAAHAAVLAELAARSASARCSARPAGGGSRRTPSVPPVVEPEAAYERPTAPERHRHGRDGTPARVDLVMASAAFVLTAHLGDHDAAAEVLHLDSRKVRDHISDLERTGRARLLTDAAGGPVPTELGGELMEPLSAAVRAAAAAAEQRLSGVLRILGRPDGSPPNADE
ncbi:LacI family DNA-binding transcriptional regulator [Microbacterium xylanilyticum]